VRKDVSRNVGERIALFLDLWEVVNSVRKDVSRNVGERIALFLDLWEVVNSASILEN
jgi:hypothetical protein